eukprot:6486570-Amphidinium_carterae.1
MENERAAHLYNVWPMSNHSAPGVPMPRILPATGDAPPTSLWVDAQTDPPCLRSPLTRNEVNNLQQMRTKTGNEFVHVPLIGSVRPGSFQSAWGNLFTESESKKFYEQRTDFHALHLRWVNNG